MTLATFITMTRIILTPFIVYFILSNQWPKALFFFACASITDFLDGFIARYYNQITLLGSIIDPVADKLLLLFSFYALHENPYTTQCIPAWFLTILILKETVQIVGALYIITQLPQAPSITAHIIGKTATCSQIILILLIIADRTEMYHAPIADYAYFLYIACTISIIALLQYTFAIIQTHRIKGLI